MPFWTSRILKSWASTFEIVAEVWARGLIEPSARVIGWPFEYTPTIPSSVFIDWVFASMQFARADCKMRKASGDSI